MIEKVQELLSSIFSGMHRTAPNGWISLELIAIGAGSSTHFTTAASNADGTDRTFTDSTTRQQSLAGG
jgi:hypothetical protein